MRSVCSYGFPPLQRLLSVEKIIGSLKGIVKFLNNCCEKKSILKYHGIDKRKRYE